MKFLHRQLLWELVSADSRLRPRSAWRLGLSSLARTDLGHVVVFR